MKAGLIVEYHEDMETSAQFLQCVKTVVNSFDNKLTQSEMGNILRHVAAFWNNPDKSK